MGEGGGKERGREKVSGDRRRGAVIPLLPRVFCFFTPSSFTPATQTKAILRWRLVSFVRSFVFRSIIHHHGQVRRYTKNLSLFYFQQGTAAFWFNLLKSGESDGSTRHAGCPVIVGSKWGKMIYLGFRKESYASLFARQTRSQSLLRWQDEKNSDGPLSFTIIPRDLLVLIFLLLSIPLDLVNFTRQVLFLKLVLFPPIDQAVGLSLKKRRCWI